MYLFCIFFRFYFQSSIHKMMWTSLQSTGHVCYYDENTKYLRNLLIMVNRKDSYELYYFRFRVESEQQW